MLKKVIEFAKKQGFETAFYLHKWQKYEVYQPVYNDEKAEIGLPLAILVEDNNIRMTTAEESFSHYDETELINL
jgi:hypothetical protein